MRVSEPDGNMKLINKTVSEVNADQTAKPQFIHQLADATSVEGNEVVIECQAVGKPMPNISW